MNHGDHEGPQDGCTLCLSGAPTHIITADHETFQGLAFTKRTAYFTRCTCGWWSDYQTHYQDAATEGSKHMRGMT